MKSKVSIFIAYHKKAPIISDNVFIPIHVGKTEAVDDLGIIGDNSGNNISNLNKYYCEMTAIYWAWKNINSDYIGLCHYRRFFTFKRIRITTSIKRAIYFRFVRTFGNLVKLGKSYTLAPAINIDDYGIINKEMSAFKKELDKHINSGYSIFCLKPFRFSSQNVEQAFSLIGSCYISKLKDIVSSNYPEYLQTLLNVLNGDKLSPCNMIIMRKDFFSGYCDFVFNVLGKHAAYFNIGSSKAYERIPGYLSEILTYTYIRFLRDKGNKIIYTNFIIA